MEIKVARFGANLAYISAVQPTSSARRDGEKGPSRTRGQNCLFFSKICHHNEKPSATGLFTKGQNLVADGQTSKMPSTTSGAGQIETNFGKQYP